jgi:cell division septation protein DedD
MSYQFGHVDREERIDYGDEPPPQMLPPHWRLPRSVVAVAVVAVFAGSLWFAYHEGTKHATSAPPAAGDQVPLLHADPQPVKVKPDRPGGMNIPDQDDPIYTRTAGGPPVEHLQPPPEKPAPRPAPVAAAPAPVAAAPAPVAALPQVAAVPAPAAAPAPPAKPAAVKPPAPAKPAPPVTGPVKIQLGSLRSPDAARDEWQRLKRENSDLLGKFTAVAVRSEVPDKGTYYRVEAGPVGDHAAAERLCKALKERGLGCTLVR